MTKPNHASSQPRHPTPNLAMHGGIALYDITGDGTATTYILLLGNENLRWRKG